MEQYQQHPLSAAFPAMSATERQELQDSIDNIGVVNPITIFEGMVIDGWHRYSVALQLGMDCPSVELGNVDPRDFVLAQNRSRRALNASQRVLAETMIAAWRPVGRPENNYALSAQLGPTNQEIAKSSQSSVRLVVQAKEVLKAAPELAKAIQEKVIGLPKAAAIAKMPREQQAEAIAKPLPKKNPVEASPAAPTEALGADDYSQPDDHEIASLLAEEKRNIGKVIEIMESGDPLGEALKENERLRLELVVVKSTRDGFMNQISEMTRIIRSLRNKIAKAGI